jgi:hypothetical protein
MQLMVALWDLLTGICFAAAVGCALASARIAKVGFGGHALAITIGIVLGGLCAWTMRAVAKTVVANFQRRSNWEHSVSLQKWFFRALYFAALLWIVFAGFLGGRLSLALLRIVF